MNASDDPASPAGASRQKHLALGLVALLAVLVAAGLWLRRDRLDPSFPSARDLPGIMREAQGSIRVPANDTPARQAVRDSFRYLVEEDRRYDAELEKRFRTPLMAKLLEPASFGHVPSMQQLITELRALKELHGGYRIAVQRFPDVTKHNLERAGLSPSGVQGLTHLVESDRAETHRLLAAALEAEAHWLDAVSALYQFAVDHEASIRLGSDQQLEFEDEVTQIEFDRLAGRVDELGQQAEHAVAAFDAAPPKVRRKAGITRRQPGR